MRLNGGTAHSARARIVSDRARFCTNKIALATSKRNAVVTAHALLFSIGRLDVASLRVPVQRYDPSIHYRNVKFRLLGLDPDRPGLFRSLMGAAPGGGNCL